MSEERSSGQHITTDKGIRALHTDRAQEDVRVGGIPGLLVRLSKTGRKTFMLIYRSPEPAHLEAQKRPQRRVTIGLYPEVSLADARAEARRLMGEVAKGLDPQSKPRPTRQGRTMKAPTSSIAGPRPLTTEASPDRLTAILGNVTPAPGSFAHLCAEYLLRHAWLHKKRTRDDESMLRRDLIPAFGHRGAADVRRRDVIELLDRIVHRGAPIAARATKALLSKIYNFGISRDLVENNPTLGVAAPKGRSREVWLRDHEIRVLWADLDRRRLVTASVFRTILLTLQRPGEVGNMEWSEIAGEWWEIPGAKTKNGLCHRVYLSAPVREILEKLRPVTGSSRFVFESRKLEGKPTLCLNKVGYAICRASGLSFTPHDLRRTGATHLGAMGVPDETIDALLNHKSGGVVKIYNRYSYDAEKREALTAWGERVTALVAP